MVRYSFPASNFHRQLFASLLAHHGFRYLSPHNPVWESKFLVLANRVRDALAEKVLLLEHVGSTSVPGLLAKPVIDMVLAVADSADESSYVPALE